MTELVEGEIGEVDKTPRCGPAAQADRPPQQQRQERGAGPVDSSVAVIDPLHTTRRWPVNRTNDLGSPLARHRLSVDGDPTGDAGQRP